MNIVLIGMPGSGKSTVGARVAQRTGRAFVDVDALIEQNENCLIRDTFARKGEPYFRRVETTMVKTVAQETNTVIATGGGVILREENMAALSKTGVIFFLDRSPQAIAGEDHTGRPLLAGDKNRIFALYAQRIARYRAYAQYIIPCGPTVADTAGRVLKTMEGAGLL